MLKSHVLSESVPTCAMYGERESREVPKNTEEQMKTDRSLTAWLKVAKNLTEAMYARKGLEEYMCPERTPLDCEESRTAQLKELADLRTETASYCHDLRDMEQKLGLGVLAVLPKAADTNAIRCAVVALFMARLSPKVVIQIVADTVEVVAGSDPRLCLEVRDAYMASNTRGIRSLVRLQYYRSDCSLDDAGVKLRETVFQRILGRTQVDEEILAVETLDGLMKRT